MKNENNDEYQHHPKNLVLDYYHCTFFLPLVGLNEDDFIPKLDRFYYNPQDNPDLAENEAQAYRYFSPALRNLLFDLNEKKGLKAVKEWRLSNDTIKSWKLNLGKTKDENNSNKYQQSKVVSVRLLQYFNGIYLLAIRVEPDALISLRQQKKSPLFNNSTEITLQTLDRIDPDNQWLYKQLAMENWLHFTRNIRLLYPTFPQQNIEEKIAPIHLIRDGFEPVISFERKIEKIKIHKKPGADFSPVICEFLKAFAKKPDKVKNILDNYTKFYDDRMFVSVAYGIAGKKLPDESLQRINTLVAYVDRQEGEGFDVMGGYAYTPKVILENTKNNAYSLWEGLGGYYSYTDFSNTYLSTGGEFRTYIGPDHIPHIYDRMLVQALFYRASLRHYDERMSEETSALLEHVDFKTIRKQHKEYIEFTNQYWFHHLTEQMQGKEIFSLQQNALKLAEHYDILKDQLERTEEYLQTEYELKISETGRKLTTYGLLFAIVALYYTVLGILSSEVKRTEFPLWSCMSNWLGSHMETCVISWEQIIIYGLLFFILPSVAIFIWWLLHNKVKS